MMSGHGVNPIFFLQERKIGRAEQSLTPHLPALHPITPHFYRQKIKTIIKSEVRK